MAIDTGYDYKADCSLADLQGFGSVTVNDGRIGRTAATGDEYARRISPSFEIRKNVLDPSEGANYSGGSSYAPRMPLLPSSVGLAGTMKLLPSEASQNGLGQIPPEVKDLLPSSPAEIKQWVDDPEKAYRDQIRPAANKINVPMPPPIPAIPLGPVLDVGEKIGDWIIGGPGKRRRKKDRNNRAQWTRLLFNNLMRRDPTLIHQGGTPSNKFKGVFRRVMLDPKNFRQANAPHRGKAESKAWTDIYTRTDSLNKLYSEYLQKNPENKKIDDTAIRSLAVKAQRVVRPKAARLRAQAGRVTPKKSIEPASIVRDMVQVFGAAFNAKPELLKGGSKAYIPVVTQWLSMKHNPALVRSLVPNSIEAAAKTYFNRHPEAKRKVLQMMAQEVATKKAKVEVAKENRRSKEARKKDKKRRRRRAEARQVVGAASRPGSRGARRTARALNKKAKELKGKKNKRAAAVKRARKETKKLRREVERLKQQFTVATTVPQAVRLQAKAAEVANREQMMAQTAVVGDALMKNAAAQEEITSQIKHAVTVGQPAEAAMLTGVYDKLSNNAALLKDVRQTQLSNWGLSTAERQARALGRRLGQ